MEEKLKNLTMGQAAIIGLVLALLYWLLYFDDGESTRRMTENVRGEIKQIETKLGQARKSIADAKRFEQVRAALGEEMDQILSYIPTDLSRTDMMKLMSEEAKAAGVNITNIQANEPQGTEWDFIQALGVTVGLEGTFSQLMSFMAFLTAKKHIMHIDAVSLSAASASSDTGNPKLTFTGSFKAFRFKEEAANENRGRGR